MKKNFIAAIDQGTTSSRCLVFDAAGAVAAVAQKEHRQIQPRPGWTEHDPLEIWENVQEVVQAALRKLSLKPADLAAIGVTNQRETTMLWRKSDGRPLANSIVWHDTRTDALSRVIGGEEGADRFRRQTGLPLASYFSGPKIVWLLDAHPEARALAERGEILFGTMDSWLIWKLTGRHLTDVTNASRTLLMNLETLDWDETILQAMKIPRAMLPEIRPSSEVYGEAGGALAGVPVASALGDQQAALFGQACFSAGDAKCTYGTGGFLLLNTGEKPIFSANGLLTTLACRIGDAPPTYALEGAIAVAGSLVQWLRDKLGLIASASEIEPLARSVPDSGGCVIVPAFSGLFAPYWRPDARGVIAGLTGFVGKAHLARAALEATAWQVREVADAMAADFGAPLHDLKVDGGMVENALLMQIQADVLNVPIIRPVVAETTCLGAAYAAGLAVGFWPDQQAIRRNWRQAGEWKPQMPEEARAAGYRQWKKAVQRTLDWVSSEDG